jgi:FAD/FMN-containing dehydrogenase
MNVTLQQQDANGYKLLQTRNAQLRGSRIMPLAFVQPSSSADVSAAVRCSVGAGLRFVARNGGELGLGFVGV